MSANCKATPILSMHLVHKACLSPSSGVPGSFFDFLLLLPLSHPFSGALLSRPLTYSEPQSFLAVKLHAFNNVRAPFLCILELGSFCTLRKCGVLTLTIAGKINDKSNDPGAAPGFATPLQYQRSGEVICEKPLVEFNPSASDSFQSQHLR